MPDQTLKCPKCGHEIPLTEAFILNTAGMYGDLQGIIGNALPSVKTLELPGGEEQPAN